MIKIRENIEKMISGMGVYDIGEGSELENEIKIYDRWLTEIDKEIEKMGKEGILQTATDEGLEKREEAMKISIKKDEKTEIRRDRIMKMLKIDDQKSKKEDIEGVIKGMGMDVEIIEDIEGEGVIIKGNEDFKEENLGDILEYKSRISSMIPAHLGVEIKIGKERTWEEMEDKEIELDEEMSWE